MQKLRYRNGEGSLKILFVGESHSNTGPANVNKRLIDNLTQQYRTLKTHQPLRKMAELFMKMSTSRVVVLSGITRVGMIALRLSRLTRTKTIYIMHGCADYEAKLNGREPNSDWLIKREKELLRSADLLLPVSLKFSEWVREHYPEYAHKTEHLFNGIDPPEKTGYHEDRRENRVIAVGADRATKNNRILSEAVESLGGTAKLIVCGKVHAQSLKTTPHTRYLGLIPQKEFYRELHKSKLFVLNSIFEPFSLSVFDALHCGCSILVSNYAGIVDLLKLEDSDILFDPTDKREIRAKIQYLLANPNHNRIASCLHYEDLSYQKRVEELTAYCESVWS